MIIFFKKLTKPFLKQSYSRLGVRTPYSVFQSDSAMKKHLFNLTILTCCRIAGTILAKDSQTTAGKNS